MKIKRDLWPFGLALVCIAPVIFIGWNLPVSASGITQQAYNLVENAGSALTMRSTLNFTGAGVSCADNAGSVRTDCTIAGGGGGGNPTISVSNAGSTGTTISTLTKLTGAPSTAVIASAGDTGGVVGITTAGAGTTGTATITIAGQVNCVFDGATTAGDYVQISATTAGNCHDIGSATYPSSNQVIGRVLSSNAGLGTYQLNLFPAEIKAATGGSGTFSAIAPYLSDGTHKIVANTGYIATVPPASPSWINSVTPATQTTGANGDFVFTGTGTYWQTVTGTTSVEVELGIGATQEGNSGQCGAWMYDSTNSKIYFLGPAFTSSSPGAPEFVELVYTYSGTGNPAFSSASVFTGYNAAVNHLKLSKSGSTLTMSLSLDGGAVLTPIATASVGTLAQGGFGGSQAICNVYSEVVN